MVTTHGHHINVMLDNSVILRLQHVQNNWDKLALKIDVMILPGVGGGGGVT